MGETLGNELINDTNLTEMVDMNDEKAAIEVERI